MGGRVHKLGDLGGISPYVTETIKRFGDYPTDELGILPAAFDPHLDLELATDAHS